ncbi:MAG: BT_3987 domain-containing protein [Muribaculaceae bacterium]
MKSIIKKSLILMVALLPVLTACQDEPEVGDTLYPTEKENYDAKVYINETASPGNTANVNIIQTPVSMVIPDETISFYVRLTKPVDTDVTVTVDENAELAAAYDNNAEVLPTGALQISNSTVTIPAGKQVSSTPVEIVVPNNDVISSLGAKGVAALSIKSSSGNFSAGQNNNAYYVVVNKTFTNIKSQSSADLAELTQIATDGITATSGDYDASDLIDGNTNQAGWYDEAVFQFSSPQTVSAISFLAYSRSTGYAPKVVEIFTSDDGENWTSQTGGMYTSSITPNSRSLEVPFVFYAGITCNYIKFVFYETVWSVGYGQDYNYPCVSEVRLYQ